MSDSDSDSSEKEHDPSQRRLDQSRQEGDIPRSADLMTAAGTGGFLLAFAVAGTWAIQSFGTAGIAILGQADTLGHLVATGAARPIGGLLLALSGPILALIIVPIAMICVVLLATRGIIFAPSKLAFKLSRLSPVATAKQKFGVEGWVEFGKSTVKLCLISLILYSYLASRADRILASIYLEPTLSSALLGRLAMEFFLIIFCIALVFGGIDYLWQRHRHIERNRMTRKEMLDEFKESEGDPHMKSSRRQRAQEVATNRMMTDVAKADVIVVNPTHYAVALRWERSRGRAPVCVAKGADEIAQRIRERAAEHGIPIHRDPPTARAMFATVEIGQEVRPEHYRAIASAIRFADAMRKRSGSKRR